MANYYIDPAGDNSDGTSLAKAFTTLKYGLSAGRIPQGSTVYVTDGLYEDTAGLTTIAFGAGSGTTIIRPASSYFIWNIPAAEDTAMAMLPVTEVNFKNVWFLNLNAQAATRWFTFSSADPTTATFDDCLLDAGYASPAAKGGGFYSACTAPLFHTLTFNRCLFQNLKCLHESETSAGDSSATIITLNACKADNFFTLLEMKKTTVLMMYNNTIVRGKGKLFNMTAAAGTVTSRNNIIVTEGTGDALTVFALSDAAAAYMIADASRWVVTNNIFWTKAHITFGSLNNFAASSTELMPLDATNKFIDPEFVAYGTAPADATLSLAATSKAAGRGLQSALPATDRNGSAWIGKDVGCYANSTATAYVPTLTAKRVAFCGDSIMDDDDVRNTFAAYPSNSALDVVAEATDPDVDGTLGLLRTGGAFWIVDWMAINQAPETIILSIGINDIITDPTNMTNAQLATAIIGVISKIAGWGIRPIWLGIESQASSGYDDTNEKAVNATVDQYCRFMGYSYGSIIERMQSFNANWKTDYYDGEDYIHPNSDGSALIASLAENLYWNRKDYYVDDAVGTATAPATYQQPITIAGLNAASAIPVGQTGRTIFNRGPSTTTFVTPVSGADTKLLTLMGGSLENIVVTQTYWVFGPMVMPTSVNGTSIASFAATTIMNITFAPTATVTGVAHNADITVVNCIFKGTTTDIYTVSGTLTQSNNIANTTDAMLDDNYRPMAGSPAINAGVSVGHADDCDGKPIAGLPDIGAYERRGKFF
jgi:lysophospholipase L1-like esterase